MRLGYELLLAFRMETYKVLPMCDRETLFAPHFGHVSAVRFQGIEFGCDSLFGR